MPRDLVSVSRRLAQGTSGDGESTTSRQALVSQSCFKRHHEAAGIPRSEVVGRLQRSSMTKGILASRTTRSAALRASWILRQRTHRSWEQAVTPWEAGSKPSPPSTRMNLGNSGASSGSPSSPAIHREMPQTPVDGMISEIAAAGKQVVSNGRSVCCGDSLDKTACACAWGNFSLSWRRRSSRVGAGTPGIYPETTSVQANIF